MRAFRGLHRLTVVVAILWAALVAVDAHSWYRVAQYHLTSQHEIDRQGGLEPIDGHSWLKDPAGRWAARTAVYAEGPTLDEGAVG